MTNIYNLFKFIEDKEGKKPDAGRAFKLKLTYAPEELSPEDLKVDGNLSLSGVNIKSIPKGLQVGGNLNLISTKITSLPNSLKVGGNLSLGYTKITSLPESLEVGGTVDITGVSEIKPEDIPESLRSKVKWAGGTWDDFNMYTNLPEIDIPTLGTVKGAKIDFAENKELIFKYDRDMQKFIEESRPEKIETYVAYIPDWGSVGPYYVLVGQLSGVPSPFVINTKDYTIKHKSKTLRLGTFMSDIRGRGTDAALSRLIPGYSKQEIPKYLQNEKGKLLRLSQIIDRDQKPVSMDLGTKKRGGLGVKGQYEDYALAFSQEAQTNLAALAKKLDVKWGDFIAYRFGGGGDANYVIKGEGPDGEVYYINRYGTGSGGAIKLYNKEFKQV
jgi:hypothetical protein